MRFARQNFGAVGTRFPPTKPLHRVTAELYYGEGGYNYNRNAVGWAFRRVAKQLDDWVAAPPRQIIGGPDLPPLPDTKAEVERVSRWLRERARAWEASQQRPEQVYDPFWHVDAD